jgi:hypothetical protein
VASTLVDSPPAAETEPQPAPTAPREPERQPQAVAPAGPACPQCGAGLAPGQDWCLGCGAGVQGATAGSGWRSAGTMLAVTAALVLGAAAAAYAALSKHAPVRAVRTATVAQAPPATTPSVTTPLGTPEATTPLPPTTTVKPPKIPLKAQTPAPEAEIGGGTEAGGGSGSNEAAENKEGSTNQTGGASGEEKPKPILLDTNAASTYNPYNYDASLFGDPSLTIDGDTTTSWTAQLNPETSPRMAEGVLIALNTPRRLSSLVLVTSSPGMTVQVYGAAGKTVPASITDPAWVALGHALVIHKHRTKLKLKEQSKSFDFVTLWISRAGQKSLGTPTAPGHVSVGELELFAVKKK